MKKRKWDILVLVALFIFSASIAFAGGEQEKKDEVTTIRWISPWSLATKAEQFPSIIEDFEKENPNIKVEYEGGITNYMELLKADLAVGNAPDLFGSFHMYFTEFAKDGLLYDMTDLYNKNDWQSQFLPLTIEWNTVNERLYGVSALCFALVWYYDVNLFDELGIDQAKTKAELFEICNKLKSVPSIQTPIASTSSAGAGSISLLGMITAQTTGIGPVIQARDETKDYMIPGLIKAVEIYKELIDNGCIDPMVTGVSHPSQVSMFATGQAAIYPMHTGLFDGMKKTIDEADTKVKLGIFDTAVNFVDDPITPYSAGGGMVWSISKDTKNLDETVKFLEFFTSTEVQRRLTHQFVTLDPIANQEIEDPILKKALLQLEAATSDSVMFIDYIPSKVMEALNAGLLDLTSGKSISPEDIMKAATKAAK